MFTEYILVRNLERSEMRAFRCVVVLSTIKAGTVFHNQPAIWIVRADNEEAAGKRIYSHFKEYGHLGKYQTISSIEYTEIILHGNMDLEEYLESREDATVCVLF